MDKENVIKLFNDIKIRALWDDEQEKWFFSVVDVIGVLTGSERPRKYWGDLTQVWRQKFPNPVIPRVSSPVEKSVVPNN